MPTFLLVTEWSNCINSNIDAIRLSAYSILRTLYNIFCAAGFCSLKAKIICDEEKGREQLLLLDYMLNNLSPKLGFKNGKPHLNNNEPYL